MRLTDWTHLMLNKLRDGIRKAIVTIGTKSTIKNNFATWKESIYSTVCLGSSQTMTYPNPAEG